MTSHSILDWITLQGTKGHRSIFDLCLATSNTAGGASEMPVAAFIMAVYKLDELNSPA